jgi:hypothetical protein
VTLNDPLIPGLSSPTTVTSLSAFSNSFKEKDARVICWNMSCTLAYYPQSLFLLLLLFENIGEYLYSSFFGYGKLTVKLFVSLPDIFSIFALVLISYFFLMVHRGATPKRVNWPPSKSWTLQR